MKWTILEVWIDENKKGEITVSIDKKITERIGTKKASEYSKEIVDILDRISKDL
ncbi:hypothetical protein [Clostridium perfringens]|uniref:hypothetical protein n=1 Tax=Clostridium perfringens TaxID=1502 RepID=UPI0024BC3B7F|nr:hypothetical protein [Clostridium perfringens]